MSSPVPCHYCNTMVSVDPNGTVYATHPRHPSPWFCWASASGKHHVAKDESDDKADNRPKSTDSND